jgi:prevent-host-death family protein
MRASNVRPITDLKNKAKALVAQVSAGGESVVITQKGAPKAVLMGVEAHDRLFDTLAMLRIIAQSQASLSKGRAYSTAQIRAAARAALGRARRIG